MNCHTQVGKNPCRSEGHTVQRAAAVFSLPERCAAAVSEKRSPGFGFSSGERTPARKVLCNLHTSDQLMSEGPEDRILVVSASLDQARAAVKRMFFLRCVFFYLNTAQIRGNPPSHQGLRR